MTPKPRSAAQQWMLRFFNRVVYTRLATAYHLIDSLTVGAWWGVVSRALKYLPPGICVLEIGFRPGWLHAEIARRASLCVGPDLAWGMCCITTRRLARLSLPTRLVCGDEESLPFAGTTFDAAVSTFTICGMPHAARVLSEAARVLARDGRLIPIDIGLPANGNSTGTFWARLWERMGDDLCDSTEMLRAAGCEVVRCRNL